MHTIYQNTLEVKDTCGKDVLHIVNQNEYANIFKYHRILFKTESRWLFAGNKENNSGVFCHISVCVAQAILLFDRVLPVLKVFQVTFRVIRNSHYHYQLNGGHFGSEEIGKAITIWARDANQMDALLKELVPLLNAFKGPSLLAKCYRIGKVIYFPIVRNGNPYFKPKGNNEFPTTYVAWPQKLWIIGKCIPVKILKYSPKGSVFKAHSLRHFSFSPCLIKEGRSDMAEDSAGRDVSHRLIWEKTVLERLDHVIPVPHVNDFFNQNDNTYLILEWLEGKSLGEVITNIRKGLNFRELPFEAKRKILDLFIAATGNIRRLHEMGYVHRDLNENNFIISPKGIVYIIDFEIAYNIHTRTPNPAFYYGMPGYAAPEQLQHATPTLKEDIYSIGILITYLLTNITTDVLQRTDSKTLKKMIGDRLGHTALTFAIITCLHTEPSKRPDIFNLEQTLKTMVL